MNSMGRLYGGMLEHLGEEGWVGNETDPSMSNGSGFF